MLQRGLEDGEYAGFGWIKGDVARLSLNDPALKIPHMGWNSLTVHTAHPVLTGIEGRDVYFCHSYAASQTDHSLATTDYGGRQVAAVGRDNMVGVQFHPEKSQALGLQVLRQFAGWMP